MADQRLYIYRYHDWRSHTKPLGVYLCDFESSNHILIVPLVPSAINESCYKLSVTKQFANISDSKKIKKSDLLDQLFIDSRAVKISEEDLLNISKYILSKDTNSFSILVDNALDHSVSVLELFQRTLQFIKWQELKYQLTIETNLKPISIYENAIYWADLGFNVGTELNKSRPVLIWKKRENASDSQYNSYIIIPATSKTQNEHYKMNVPIDINGKRSYFRIEDMRRISVHRITRPILDDQKKLIFIGNEKRNEIKDAIRSFYIFDNQYTK